MGINWTEPQRMAIDARDSNIIVSAAAGSGKTTVLVQRVIERITDINNPTSLDRLLIVTFTNAAATEMKNKISSKLSSVLQQDPNNTLILEQMTRLGNASICTIDSFCINLVRENFFNLDIEQDFKILDESEQRIVEQRALDDVIGEYYDSENSRFEKLVELLSGSKNDSRLIDTIKNIYSFIMSQAFPYEWLDDACALYDANLPLSDSILKDYIFKELDVLAEYSLNLIELSQDSLVVEDELFDKYSSMLEKDKDIFVSLKKAIKTDSWNIVKEFVSQIKISTMPYKRNYTSPVKTLLANNREVYKDYIKNEIQPFFSLTEEDYIADCNSLYPLVVLLKEITISYSEKLLQYKKDLNSYSFSDIEHFAIQLLFFKNDCGKIELTPLARELQSKFDEILVDEYQDTNRAQDNLFEKMSNGKNRFMVGDVKQSIYRFRMAMPFIFNEKKDSYSDYEKNGDSITQRIILATNYRSRFDICSFTNFVFSRIMSKRVGELDYDEKEYLNCGADYQHTDVPSVCYKIIETPDDCNKIEFEAQQVADIIKNKILCKEKVKDSGEYREIKYGDFAVLFRSAKTAIPIYTKVLEKNGIPVVANNRINLFDNSEIKILLNFLRVIDNPVQDIPLLATLMSVFYGYTADEISSAKLNNPSSNLYSSIIQDSAFNKFSVDLERYRGYVSCMSVENFIRRILSETSFTSIISAMGNHTQRTMNIMKFIDIARKFDGGENVGLTAFIRYVDTIISSNLNVDSANVASDGENAVMLMSVHHSKGLEFPVCILADSSHKYNRDELSNQLLLNSHLGIGLKVHNEQGLYRYNSLQYSVIKNMNAYELMSENLRVLYVAITRAKEQFIVCYSSKSFNTHIDSLSKKLNTKQISPSVVKNISNDGDLLLLCALLHPDGAPLRKLCEDDIEFETQSDFTISIDFLTHSFVEENIEEEQECYNPVMLEELREKLSYVYDNKNISSFASKRVASSLDNNESNYKYLTSSKPAFLSKSNMTSAQKGTAMHTFMEHCDYHNCMLDLEKEIDRLVALGHLDKNQADVLERSKIKNLFNSELVDRMMKSPNIYKEIRVSSFVPVRDIEDTDSDEKVLIQGCADCVFEEDGELVLVDYKTDKVSNENELLDMYKKQISFYRDAVSKTLCKPVKQALLYSFSLNKICEYK